jgi:hypothetical protein
MRFNSGSINNALGVGAGEGVGAGASGSCNNWFGNESGQFISTGNCNSAMGWRSMVCATTASRNVALGLCAAYSVTVAINSTYLGQNAGRDATTGFGNTFLGQAAGRSATTGAYNTAIGQGALRNIAASGCNTGIGTNAGQFTTGCYNLFAGYEASGNDFTTGNNNIAIGCCAGGPGGGFIIGALSNQIVMGNTAHTNAYVNVAWAPFSDGRRKIVHGNVPLGLEFVNKLNTVEWSFKDEETGEETDPTRRYGFIAQEVQALEVDPKNPVIVETKGDRYLSLKNDYLVPTLVNAIQELTARLEALEGKNP